MALYDKGTVVVFENKSKFLTPEPPLNTTVRETKHIVKEGETLYSIARKYFRATTKWYLIADINKLEDLMELTVGDILIIPHNG